MVQLQMIQHFAVVSEFVFLFVGGLGIFVKLPEHMRHSSKPFVEPFFTLDIPAQRFPGYVFGYKDTIEPVSYTHLRAHETDSYLVCRLLLEKKKNYKYI